MTGDSTDSSKVGTLEAENKALKKSEKAFPCQSTASHSHARLSVAVDELVARISKLETRVSGWRSREL